MQDDIATGLYRMIEYAFIYKRAEKVNRYILTPFDHLHSFIQVFARLNRDNAVLPPIWLMWFFMHLNETLCIGNAVALCLLRPSNLLYADRSVITLSGFEEIFRENGYSNLLSHSGPRGVIQGSRPVHIEELHKRFCMHHDGSYNIQNLPPLDNGGHVTRKRLLIG